MLLMKFRLILVTDPVILIIIQKGNYTRQAMAPREVTASHGRTDDNKNWQNKG